MKMKVVAILAFVFNVLMYGSYYAIAKGALSHIDPIVFTFLTMLTLLPPGLCIIVISWRHMTRAAARSGFLLGSCLCLGLFTLAVALKYNSATGTAFFPSLNGLLAAIFAWYVLRQPIAQGTWFGGIVSVTGAVLLMLNASMGGTRGALIAFIGGLFCTAYIFLADHEQGDEGTDWPLFGVELVTMSVWAGLIALLFGDWQNVTFVLPGDLLSILFVGLCTIFVPTLFTLLFQKYISPVTVSFLSILEPILGALVAFLYLHEVLPLDGYLGGFLVVAGVLIHTWGSLERPRPGQVVRQHISKTKHVPWLQALVYPLLCCVVGFGLTYMFGGFPPTAWIVLLSVLPRLGPLFQQGAGVQVLLIFLQSLSWLLVWGSLIVIAGLALYRSFRNLVYTGLPASVEGEALSFRQVGYMSRPERSYTLDKPSQARRPAVSDEMPHVKGQQEPTVNSKYTFHTDRPPRPKYDSLYHSNRAYVVYNDYQDQQITEPLVFQESFPDLGYKMAPGFGSGTQSERPPGRLTRRLELVELEPGKETEAWHSAVHAQAYGADPMLEGASETHHEQFFDDMGNRWSWWDDDDRLAH